MKTFEFIQDISDEDRLEKMHSILDEMDAAVKELAEHNKKIGNVYAPAVNRSKNTQTSH